jgi:hypothetical protein
MWVPRKEEKRKREAIEIVKTFFFEAIRLCACSLRFSLRLEYFCSAS